MRIGVLKLDHVGDFWMALRALNLLREQFRDAHITLITASWNIASARQLGVADDFVAYDFFSRNPRLVSNKTIKAPAIDTLVGEPFDLAIDLRVPLETRSVLKSVPALRRAAIADKHAMPWVDIAVPPLPIRVRRPLLFRLAELLRLPPRTRSFIDPHYRDRRANIQHMEDMLSFLVAKIVMAYSGEGAMASSVFQAIPPSRRPIVIAPTSNSQLRDWPADRCGCLIARLESLGSPISLIGRPESESVIDAIVEAAAANGATRANISSSCRLPDDDFVAYLATARLVISNNSGAGHVAARLGIPTVGIYTASHLPDLWGFRGPKVSMMVANIECGGCGFDVVSRCPRAVRCKFAIEPEDVWAEVDALMTAAEGNKTAATATRGVDGDFREKAREPVGG
jgi:ADP-heptose:LPS heptosyltransferase